MSTQIEICNSAIAKVRGRPILTLVDNTTEARLLSSLYHPIRKKLLRSHPWNFAKRRAELAALVAAPEYEYSTMYQLPADCLRLLKTDLSDGQQWVLEEDTRVLCNSETLRVLYIADITDESRFDATFAEVFAYMLAEQLAYPLTQGASLAAAMREAAKAEMREARSFNGQERGTVEVVEAQEWLNSRF